MARTRDNAPSEKAMVRQTAARAHYDKETVYKVIDDAVIAIVAMCVDGSPVSIPMAIARIDDHIYLHGSRSSRLMKQMAAGGEVSICISHLDGIVVARSGMHCSANYRSVVIHGCGIDITSDAKASLLHRVVFGIIPGSEGDYREHLAKELKATTLIAVPLNESACKIRAGGPSDDKEDLDLPFWAGVIPVTQTYGAPIPSDDLPEGIETPDYALNYKR